MKTMTAAMSLGVFSLSLLIAGPAMARVGTEVCGDNDHEDVGERRGKAINGLECQIDWADKHKTTWGYTAGQICNSDKNEEILVHCPLMREQTESTEGLTCAAATLVHQNGGPAVSTTTPCSWLYDTTPNSSTRFECVLRSSLHHGWGGWWFGWGTDGNPNIKLQPFGGTGKIWATEWHASMWHSAVVDGDYFHGGTYTLSCELPPLNSCGGEVCLSSLKWFEAEAE